jgi:hypothetical protein
MENKVPFCARCEKRIDIGGFLVMPGQDPDEGRQFCLECAIDTVVEESPTQIKRIGFVRPEQTE